MVFLQVVSKDEAEIAIPGESFGFGELKQAQADGDLAALLASGKRAFRVPLAQLLDAGE
jgi:glucose-6-phosphate isomerase/transaldolase/glucose-6-phosphate isomerase